jgi:hypothetical protein
MTRETWAESLLTALGYPVTKLAVTDVMSWEAQENTNAKFNPLATTQPMPGSTMFNDLGNGIGVQNYTSAEQGLEATVKTLNNGYYPEILDALSIGGTGDFGLTVSQTQWGTGFFTVSGQPTKALTSPTDSGTTTQIPPDVTKYPGLQCYKGVYYITWASGLGMTGIEDFLHSTGQANTSDANVMQWDQTSADKAKKYGIGSQAYLKWVNDTLPALYGKKGALTPAGGSEGNTTGLMSDLTSLTLKDLYIIIGVILVGILAIILIARAIKPAAQAVAPLAALAV